MPRPVFLALSLIIPFFMLANAVSHPAKAEQYRFVPTNYWGDYAPVIRGPQKAVGAFIWNHGRDNMNGRSDLPAPPIALYFSQSGWDGFALRRIAYADREHEARAKLNEAVGELRQRGYRRIVLMGQSAGAWISLLVAGDRTDIEAVVGLAPACCGRRYESAIFQGNADYFFPLLHRVNPQTKIAMAFFRGDEFDPGGRGERARQILRDREISGFVIDEPAYSFLEGHGAGESWHFSRRYGACIARFIETATTPRCDESREALRAEGLVLPTNLRLASGTPGGLWLGTWDSGRVAALAIETVGDDEIGARYVLGPGAAPQRERPEATALTLAAEGTGWHWSNGRVSFTFEPMTADLIRGTARYADGAEGRILLKRQPDLDPVASGAPVAVSSPAG